MITMWYVLLYIIYRVWIDSGDARDHLPPENLTSLPRNVILFVPVGNYICPHSGALYLYWYLLYMLISVILIYEIKSWTNNKKDFQYSKIQNVILYSLWVITHMREKEWYVTLVRIGRGRERECVGMCISRKNNCNFLF